MEIKTCLKTINFYYFLYIDTLDSTLKKTEFVGINKNIIKQIYIFKYIYLYRLKFLFFLNTLWRRFKLFLKVDLCGISVSESADELKFN